MPIGLGNAATGIGHRNLHPGPHRAGSDFDAVGDKLLTGPPIGDHGVAGVDHEVEKHLLQTIGMGLDAGDLAEVQGHLDALQGQIVADDGENAPDGFVDIHVFQHRLGLAPEIPQVADDRGGPVHLGADLARDGGQDRRRRSPAGFGQQLQVVAAHLDGVERLVEFVGDAGGHFAEGFHLARLDELGVLFHQFGDVRGRDDDRVAPPVGDAAGVQVDVQRPAVAPDMAQLGEKHLPRRVAVGEIGGHAPGLGVGLQIGHVPPGQFLAGIAVDVLGLGIGVKDTAVGGIDDEDRVGVAVEKRPVLLFGLAQPAAVQPDAPDHIAEGFGQLGHFVAAGILAVKAAFPAGAVTGGIGGIGIGLALVEVPAGQVGVGVGRAVSRRLVDEAEGRLGRVETAPADGVGGPGQARERPGHGIGKPQGNEEHDDRHGRDKSQKGGAQGADQGVDVFFGQPHMDRTQRVDALAHGDGDIDGLAVLQIDQPDAVIAPFGQGVGLGQVSGEGADEGMGQDAAFIVLDKDVGDEDLAFPELGGVKDEADQIGPVLVQDEAAGPFGDALADGHAALFQLAVEAGHQDPAGQQRNDGADQQHHGHGAAEHLELETDPALGKHGRLSDRSRRRGGRELFPDIQFRRNGIGTARRGQSGLDAAPIRDHVETAVVETGEIDPLQALMPRGVEADGAGNAHGKIRDGLDGVEEALPRQLAPGPAQALHQDLGVDKALQSHRVGPLVREVAGQQPGILRDAGQQRPGFGQIRRRHDLGHDQRRVVPGSENAGDLIGPDKGHGVEKARKPPGPGQFDGLGARAVGADHDDGLGPGVEDAREPLLHVHGAPDVGAPGHGGQTVGPKRHFRALEAVETVGVVLVKNGHPVESQVPHHVLHGGGGLLIVGSPDVDDVPAKRRAQDVGPGEAADKRHFGLFQQGDDLGGRRRADVAEKTKHLVLDDELLGVGHAARRVVAVIQGQHPDPAPGHPAGIVDGVQIGQGPEKRLLAEVAGMAGQRQGRADGHGVAGDAGGIRRPRFRGGRSGTADQETDQRQGGQQQDRRGRCNTSDHGGEIPDRARGSTGALVSKATTVCRRSSPPSPRTDAESGARRSDRTRGGTRPVREAVAAASRNGRKGT